MVMSMALQSSAQPCTCQIAATRSALPGSRGRSSVCSASRQDPQPSGRRELFSLLGSAVVALSSLPAFAAEELQVKAGQELKPENNKAKSEQPAASPEGVHKPWGCYVLLRAFATPVQVCSQLHLCRVSHALWQGWASHQLRRLWWQCTRGSQVRVLNMAPDRGSKVRIKGWPNQPMGCRYSFEVPNGWKNEVVGKVRPVHSCLAHVCGLRAGSCGGMSETTPLTVRASGTCR